MRTYKLLSLILVLGIGFSACYDEDAIHTTKGDIPYELKEGGDEVDQYIYKFLNNLLIIGLLRHLIFLSVYTAPHNMTMTHHIPEA